MNTANAAEFDVRSFRPNIWPLRDQRESALNFFLECLWRLVSIGLQPRRRFLYLLGGTWGYFDRQHLAGLGQPTEHIFRIQQIPPVGFGDGIEKRCLLLVRK